MDKPKDVIRGMVDRYQPLPASFKVSAWKDTSGHGKHMTQRDPKRKPKKS